MNNTAEVIQFKEDTIIDYEDIICVLNPIQACDLKQVLLITHEDRRLNVALAFADIDVKQLCAKAGFDADVYIYKLIRGGHKLPLGVAFRFARVLGVPVEILFQSPKYRKESKC